MVTAVHATATVGYGCGSLLVRILPRASAAFVSMEEQSSVNGTDEWKDVAHSANDVDSVKEETIPTYAEGPAGPRGSVAGGRGERPQAYAQSC